MPIVSDPAGKTEDVALDPRRKRARFRAWHRGTREMDLVMGRFADREMAGLSPDDLDRFERLMDEPDQLVFAWISRRTAAPEEHDTPLLERLREYRG